MLIMVHVFDTIQELYIGLFLSEAYKKRTVTSIAAHRQTHGRPADAVHRLYEMQTARLRDTNTRFPAAQKNFSCEETISHRRALLARLFNVRGEKVF